MSDTVKLIVEISKEHYQATKALNMRDPYLLSGGETAIAHGIPLDDVKAEIDKQEFTHHQRLNHWYMTPLEVKSVVFEILDNIGKAENEDK